jgi:hypothetical protein
MGCAVLGSLATTFFAAYLAVGIWIIAPLPWAPWGPESSHRARSRLARVGATRWFVVIVGALWDC